MALNLKNAEVESLASKLSRAEPIDAVLASVRERFPNADYGRRLSREKKEAALGFGPDGV